MKLARLPIPKYLNEFISFKGGLDTTSPQVQIPPGYAQDSVNFEEDINGGYASLTGYERFSGKTSPSSALIFALPYSAVGSVYLNTVLTGAISGATAVVVAYDFTKFYVTAVVGNFVAESVGSGAVITGTQQGVVQSSQALANYKSTAAGYYRQQIAAVPGDGSIRGVWYYRGAVYAFRDNVGAGVGMYKSSSSGWQAVALGFQVNFSAGSGTPPAEGINITKGATTGVLKRLVLETGTFGAGTAAGRLIFASITSRPFTAGAFTSGIVATAVSQSDITIPNKGGRFEFENTTFTGSMANYRMYGVDGVNNGFEFDGTTFVPIVTPLDTTRKPAHLAVHQDQLFYSYESSFLNSNLGNPYGWTTTGGTAELTMGDRITGFKVQPGSSTSPSMAVFARNRTKILYGTSSADFQLVSFNDEQGAIPWSIQKIHQTLYFDDRGVTSLAQAQEFGNFTEATLSFRVKKLLATKRNAVSDSHITRDKQQYRLFFTDGSGMYFLVDSKGFSAMPVRFPNPVLCSVSAEVDGGGEEVIYFGSSNGFVYQMERGTSFDGANIDGSLTLAFNHSKSYRALKRYRHLTLEMTGLGYHQFVVGYSLSYGSEESAQPLDAVQSIDPVFVRWDEFVWDEFVWDGDQTYITKHIAINGDGSNLALKIKTNAVGYERITLSGVFLEWSLLRMLR